MIKPGTTQAGSEVSGAGTGQEAMATRLAPGNVRSISSEELLGLRGELKIQHNGELYSLRRTRQGKLILTK